MKATSILIIDDEIKLTNSLAFTLRQAGMTCYEAHNGFTGVEIAKRENPDVVLLDVRMPGMDGLEVLDWFSAELPDTPVIVMSAFDDTQDAVAAMKMGAVDYISKPFDINDLIDLLKETNTERQLEAHVQHLSYGSKFNTNFLGQSQIIMELRDQITRISASNLTNILITGETGTGKAVVARQLHFANGDSSSPFVEVNCATLPEKEIDVELFGAEKGAMPGFASRRKGLVEIADGGTLLLDEVGEIPLSIQAKLLSFMETRNYRPIGSPRECTAKVTVIATTNQNLECAVQAEKFRQDLFFRLNIMPLHVPPLRERREDISLLALHFAILFATEAATDPIQISKEVREFLKSYDWPGNVRELKNLVERLTILYPGQVVAMEHLPSEFKSVEAKADVSIEESMDIVERNLIQEALLKSRGRKGLAADRLGISRHALKRKMQRLGIT